MKPTSLSRRDLLRAGVAAAIVPTAQRAEAETSGKAADDPWHGLKVGVASYSLRLLPLETAIRDIQRVGLGYVSIKDAHLPLNSTTEQRKAVRKQFEDAGITPLSCGNITMKNDEADVRRAFEYARDIGLPTIVCSPHPDSLPLVERMVREFDIRIAIHNHGPGDRFASPYDAWRAVQPFDKRLGLCIDVGHTVHAGVDPAKAILDCRDRLYDMHFKDLKSAAPNSPPVEVGRGVLDKRAILAAALTIGYSHLLSFEHEKDPNDPLPGLAESVGYTRGLLEGMSAKE